MSGRPVLAIASGGGHWVQLLRLRPAFGERPVVYASVSELYAEDVPGCAHHVVTDANREQPWRILLLAFEVARLVWRTRPGLVISTGAAPGLFGLLFGRLLGARTVWVDSVANVERLSLSGRLARPFAQLWLTQWPHLAREGGPEFAGSVL